MRVDVDFNQRNRDGHVIARVPHGPQAVRLAPGSRVYLYDPLERLWAEATVVGINEESQVAAFDVDWHSFTDAEVADLTVGHRHWFFELPHGEGHWVQPSAIAENASQPAWMMHVTMYVVVSRQAADAAPATWFPSGNSTAGTQATVVVP
jgi:hypothetical protein